MILKLRVFFYLILIPVYSLRNLHFLLLEKKGIKKIYVKQYISLNTQNKFVKTYQQEESN